MAFARHGTGTEAAIRALASQVHPVFMLPPLAAAGFGAVLADRLGPVVLAVHGVAVFAALYTAHLKDGYVDFHARGEDDDHPMTPGGCRMALLGATVVFGGCLAVLFVLVDPLAALLTLPGWLIGYFHAPQLDMNPLGATMGYPAGVGFALLSGHYVQAESLSQVAMAFATVFVIILSGVKVIDDAKDYDYDRTIQKRTVAVVLGRHRARTVAYALMAAGLLGVVLFAALAVFPPTSLVAALAFGAVAVTARRAEPPVATMLLVRGSYVFLAVLVVAVWFRPFA